MIEIAVATTLVSGVLVAWVLGSDRRPPKDPPAPFSWAPTPLEEVGYHHPQGWPVFKVNGIPVAFEPSSKKDRGIEFYTARSRTWAPVPKTNRAEALKAALRG